ncbi:hypothetical protein PIB30_088164 [Stylosanthes scabra]|uniref:Uncharacterized protein n=1 Tax=Stylosanthes scabra TaxID=79078 RepID=A0ABU6UTV3_9FABA|nr:hypothetical protein [Stylosanthes scabra]
MPILKPKYLTEGLIWEDKYPVFWESLDKQYLKELLFVKERYYPRLMAAVSTTLRIQDDLDVSGYGKFVMVFWLAGFRYALGLNKLASIWGLQNMGILFKGVINPPECMGSFDSEPVQWTLQVASVGGENYSVGRMTTDHRLLHYVLTYVILPRKGNHGTLNEDDLIILWAMVRKLEFN